jgi:hypothetical protein
MNEQPGKRRLRVVAFVALAFVAGMTTRGLLSSSRPSPSAPAPASNASPSDASAQLGPRDYRDGIPVGFARSERGAVAAAVAYVLAGQALVDMPPTRVGGAIRTMAATASADRQVIDAEQRLQTLRDVLDDGTGPIHYLQAVLATRVDAYTPERARVSVWSVGVLSRAKIASPQAGWNISTFELVWERDDWKVWSETITAGPAPILNAATAPASSEELEDALRGFVSWSVGS